MAVNLNNSVMKTTNDTNGRGIFRTLASFPVLITAILLFFTVSCEKEETPADDPENFVKISISGVSDGHFTADFQAGKNTKTIEYAVCHAVNMKADSTAFMKGSLGNIQQAVPGEDGKASIPFDFSDPLDFGPYTVYARAISESGQASRFVKEQVCALTTGVTVEHVSRARYKMKTSYHGADFIVAGYRQSKQNFFSTLDRYGYEQSLDGIADYIMNEAKQDAQDGWLDLSTPIFNDGQAWEEQFFWDLDSGNSSYTCRDDQIVGFVTSDGTKITGAYAFEIPLQEYDPSIPLPDSMKVEIDFSQTVTETGEWNDGGGTATTTYEYFPVEISMGDDYEHYFYGHFTGNFYDFVYEYDGLMDRFGYLFGQNEEEMLKWYFTSGAFNYTLGTEKIDSSLLSFHGITVYSNGETVEDYYPELTIVACPVNWNDESVLGITVVKVPEEYLNGAGTTGMATKGTGKKVTFTVPVTYFEPPCDLTQGHHSL